MNPLHCMIDIETLSVRPTAVILSIGAAFLTDPETSEYSSFAGELYYTQTDAHHRADQRFSRDAETEQWWAQQPADLFPREGAGSLHQVLAAFAAWFSLTSRHLGDEPENVRVWSYGAAFDLPILRNAAAVEGITLPWHYRNERCLRTVLAAFPVEMPELVEYQQKHHALNDAFYQAHQLGLVGNAHPSVLECDEDRPS